MIKTMCCAMKTCKGTRKRSRGTDYKEVKEQASSTKSKKQEPSTYKEIREQALSVKKKICEQALYIKKERNNESSTAYQEGKK